MVPEASHFPIIRLAAIVACILAFVPTLQAFVIQLGDSRQTVIETYGYPKSQAQLDTREIFNYAEGSIVLKEGRVAEIRFTKGEPRSLRRVAPVQNAPVRTVPVAKRPQPQAAPAPELIPTSAPLSVPTKHSEQAPRSLLKVFAPLLWIPVVAVIVGVLKVVLRNRICRREIDFIGASPVRSASSPPSSPTPAPRSEITKLTREALDRLEWRRFEELTQAYFEKIGWSVKRSAVGADGGIDIFLWKFDPQKRTACVQCKQRSNEIIGVKYIREFFGAMVSEGISEGYFVTTSTFSEEAARFAQGKPLHLISGEDLLRNFALLSADQHEAAVRHAFRDDFETPTCPSCDVKMVRKRGSSDFWGCRNFPRCQRTFRISKE